MLNQLEEDGKKFERVPADDFLNSETNLIGMIGIVQAIRGSRPLLHQYTAVTDLVEGINQRNPQLTEILTVDVLVDPDRHIIGFSPSLQVINI